MKTLVVGIDAACWEYLNPLLHRGRMPTLQGLIARGSHGTLQSTMPPWTPAAWSSIVTGKYPGQHGVFDMEWRPSGSLQPIPTNSTVRQGAPFWHYLNEAGLRVGLVNIPYTYPVTQVDGFMLAGFGAPLTATDLLYPTEAWKHVDVELRDYRSAVATEILRNGTLEEKFEAERHHQFQQVRIAAQLAAKIEVDILAINLMFTDHANHLMHDMDKVQAAYEETDQDLAFLLGELQPEHVIAISDHGSTRLKGTFLLGNWLTDHGYFVPTVRDTAEQRDALNWLIVNWFKANGLDTSAAPRLARQILRLALSHLPDRATASVWRQIEAAMPFASEYVLYEDQPNAQLSWVLPGTAFSGLLYANRDVQPATRPIRRHSLTELRNHLLTIADPDDGRPLFSNVYLGENIYEGTTIGTIPDLVLDFYESGWNVRLTHPGLANYRTRGNYFVDLDEGQDGGWHSKAGLAIFNGPSFATKVGGLEGSVTDIPATLLHLYSIPIPEDWDGVVIKEAFRSGYFDDNPIRSQPAITNHNSAPVDMLDETEKRLLQDQLKALGYL